MQAGKCLPPRAPCSTTCKASPATARLLFRLIQMPRQQQLLTVLLKLTRLPCRPGAQASNAPCNTVSMPSAQSHAVAPWPLCVRRLPPGARSSAVSSKRQCGPCFTACSARVHATCTYRRVTTVARVRVPATSSGTLRQGSTGKHHVRAVPSNDHSEGRLSCQCETKEKQGLPGSIAAVQSASRRQGQCLYRRRPRYHRTIPSAAPCTSVLCRKREFVSLCIGMRWMAL